MKNKLKLTAIALAIIFGNHIQNSYAEPSAAPSAPNHPPGYIAPVPSAVLPIWPGEPPNLVAGGRPESVKNERFINVSVPQIFVYLPPKEKATGTALLICAGGGYGGLAMCIHVDNVVKMLNDQGIAVIGVKYRTAYGKNDVAADAMADGLRAIQLVRSHAGEWNIDPNRVGIQGYSAGANLCLNILGHFSEGDPSATDPVARFSNRPDFCLLMSTWPHKKSLEDYSIAPNPPPTWLASAWDDSVAPFDFSQGIYEKMKASGANVEIFTVEKGGHGAFHYEMTKSPGGRWPEPAFEWLKKNGLWEKTAQKN